MTALQKGSQEPTFIRTEVTNKTRMRFPQKVIKDFLKDCGIVLMPFQWMLLFAMLAVTPGNAGWLHKKVGFMIPRRNGKTMVIKARIYIGLCLFREDITFSAHNASLSNSLWREMRNDVKKNAFLREYLPLSGFGNSQGIKTITTSTDPETGNEGNLYLLTRGDSSSNPSRGEARDLIIYDEAHLVKEAHTNAMGPTIGTKAWGQAIYLGTPPNQEIGEGEWFVPWREKMKTSDAVGRVFWAEWSIQHVVDRSDRKYWFLTNPALNNTMSDGNGLTEEFLEGSDLTDIAFARELLCFMPEKDTSSLIDYKTWADLRDPDYTREKSLTEKLAVGVKVNQAGTVASVAVASADMDRSTYVDITYISTEPLSWAKEIAEILVLMVDNKKCVGIIVDGGTLSEDILKHMSFHGNRYWNPNVDALKQGKTEKCRARTLASGVQQFVTAVSKKELIHSTMDSDPFSRAVAVCEKRKIRGTTEGFGFESMNPSVDVSILESASLAFSRATMASAADYGRAAAGGIRKPKKTKWNF